MEGTEAQKANMEHCLDTILKHCCVKIPSWSEVCYALLVTSNYIIDYAFTVHTCFVLSDFKFHQFPQCDDEKS